MKLRALLANGGFKVHLVREDNVALCGHKPGSPDGHLFRRGRWKSFAGRREGTEFDCQACHKKLALLQKRGDDVHIAYTREEFRDIR